MHLLELCAFKARQSTAPSDGARSENQSLSLFELCYGKRIPMIRSLSETDPKFEGGGEGIY